MSARAERKGRAVMTTAIAYILASVVLGAIGQILLKKGMSSLGPLTLHWAQLLPTILRIVANPYVLSGLVVYMGGVLFWLAALSQVDLSYAYPFASLGYVAMMVASWLLFGEAISPLRLVGTAVIVAGVLIISRS